MGFDDGTSLAIDLMDGSRAHRSYGGEALAQALPLSLPPGLRYVQDQLLDGARAVWRSEYGQGIPPMVGVLGSYVIINGNAVDPLVVVDRESGEEVLRVPHVDEGYLDPWPVLIDGEHALTVLSDGSVVMLRTSPRE